jgi:hypothetical protein
MAGITDTDEDELDPEKEEDRGSIAVADEDAESPLASKPKPSRYAGAYEQPSITGQTIAGSVPSMGATPGLDAAKSEIASRPPSITGESLAPQPAAPSITAGPLESAPQPTRPLGPAAQREQDLLANKPKYHGFKKVLDILGRATGLGRTIEEGTGLGTLGYEEKLRQAGFDSAREQALAKQPLDLESEQARTQEEQARAESLKHPAAKSTKPEGFFDKAGNLLGFQMGGELLGPGNPKLTPDMQQMLETAAPKAAPEKPAHLSYDPGSGIPVSATDSKGTTYDVNDPKLPPELKALVDSANRAHGQHETEEEARQNRTNAASDSRQARTFAQQEKMFQEHQEAPTAATKTMIESVPKVKALIAKLRPLADKETQGGGPLGARWTDFWNNKVGAPNESYSKMRVDDGLLATALMRMHVGSRGGELMMQHFSSLLGLGHQSPQNYKAALDAIDEYADTVAEEKPGAKTQEAGKGTGGGAKLPSFAEWQKSKKKPE